MGRHRCNPQVNYNYNYMMPAAGYIGDPGIYGAYPGTHVPGAVAGAYADFPGGYPEMYAGGYPEMYPGGYPGMYPDYYPELYPGMYAGYYAGYNGCNPDYRRRHRRNFPWWLLLLPFVFPFFGPFF